MSLLVDLTIRISLIILVALGVTTVLKRRSAALRHWVLAAAVACATATPAIRAVFPSWTIGLDSMGLAAAVDDSTPQVATTMVVGQPSRSPRAAIDPPASSAGGHASGALPIVLGSVWLAGVLVSLLVLGTGLVNLARLASRATRVEGGRLSLIAEEVRAGLRLRRRVSLLQGADSAMLITWGAARPRVLVPAGVTRWSDDRVRVVLQHEFAHIARGDWVAQIAGEVLRAAFWFNPLLWIACRRLRDESEHACDDVVLSTGIAPADYASHLLDLARLARRSTPALAMARSSTLEGRVIAMLNTRTARHPVRPAGRLVTLAVFAALAVPVATAQTRVATLNGTVLDQTSRLVPDAALVLTNAASGASHEIRTDRTGRFEFPALAAGEYQLVVQRPGFKTFTETVTVAGTDVSRVIHLQIGSLQETLNIAGSTAEGASAANSPASGEQSRERARQSIERASEKCSSGPTAGELGGQIVPPVKLTHVRPEYPASLKGSGVGGVVTLDALIGADGEVRDVTPVSSPHPELERVSIEAVRRWKFSTTYLNCTPVDVPMRVVMKFDAQ